MTQRRADLHVKAPFRAQEGSGGILDQFWDTPDMVGNAGSHRGRRPDRDMVFAKVVIAVVQRHCRAEVDQLLAEGIGGPSNSSDVHPGSVILLFDERGGDVEGAARDSGSPCRPKAGNA